MNKINVDICSVLSGSEAESMERAAQRIQSGKLVAFPTETVYGLGADARNHDAVRRIFEMKRRPPNNPLIVHGTSIESLLSLSLLDGLSEQLFRTLGSIFWPGPLTLVVPAAKELIGPVTAFGSFIGLRIPRHPVATELLRRSGRFIAAPSANRSGLTSATTAHHIAQDFAGEDLLVLDGGACEIGIESTVVKMDSPHEMTILRAGFITAQLISSLCRERGIEVNVGEQQLFRDAKSETILASPGQLLSHYAPKKPSFILKSREIFAAETRNIPFERCAYLGLGRESVGFHQDFAWYENLSEDGDPVVAARHLFSAIRRADDSPAEVILLPSIETFADGLLFAISDRIFRACSGKYAVFTREGIRVSV